MLPGRTPGTLKSLVIEILSNWFHVSSELAAECKKKRHQESYSEQTSMFWQVGITVFSM